MQVPFVDLRAQHARIRVELDAALRTVIDAAAFVNGPAVLRFETELAQFSGTRHARGVSSGTAALSISLRALGLPAESLAVLELYRSSAAGERVKLPGAGASR